ncbi:MAG: ATP-binding cassette domain-containing protein [Treponema sp.]|jgi:ABC-type transporter Mla maintaining outer membrane lipid asymmetry ATPase subunit MlaF|nr:ATP-binding cassette domain-containing protein [Treponema sp.]
MAFLELNDVSFSAQDRVVVKSFSYQYEEGKTTALVGPSGDGKSTVLKLSAGLLVPSGGEVSFRGKNIAHMNRRENLEFRQEAAVVFQDSALWANQNLFEILELPLLVHFPRMTRKERQERVDQVLKAVGYRKELNFRPSQLSMGEHKLIAFARAIICRPKILFLDEWTESLDDSASQRLVKLVRQHQAEGHTVIFVSHDPRLVRSLADKVLMIMGGELYLQLTRDQIESDDDIARYLEQGITA